MSTVKQQNLRVTQKKLVPYLGLRQESAPQEGWIKAIRKALGMTMRQLGERLEISTQGVGDLERREASGGVTLKTLRDTAEAMEMKFVYGFVPIEESLEKMIENRARALAAEIVARTSQSMRLEDQENSSEHLERAIQEKTHELKVKLPSYLWN